MFPSVSPKQSFPALESEVLAYWKANNTFQKSIDSRPEDNPYRFYDGPPFITGTPHYGSLLSSIVKDVVGRYWTMRGRRVDRVWGWDCHGLPIEEKVQKKLGLSSNKEIEERGVKEFIDGCYEYTQSTSAEWDWYIDKIGRWVDMDHAYRTMDQDYMESVMWVFKQLWDKGLVYEGKRVSLYSWKLSTPISNFEVAMDDTYQEVNDPAITLKFHLEPNDKFPEGTSVLAWTTTPWTIPANLMLAVGKEIEYLLVEMNESVVSLTRQNVLKKYADSELSDYIKDISRFPELNEIEFLETLKEARGGNEVSRMKLAEGNLWLVTKVLQQYSDISIPKIDLLQEGNVGLFKGIDNFILEGSNTDRSNFETTIIKNIHDAIRAGIGNHLTESGSKEEITSIVGEALDLELPKATLADRAYYIVAKNRAETVFKGRGEYTVIREFKGSELAGLQYIPPFPEYYHGKQDKTHTIYTADFATDTDGTGIVHCAPEFGDVDFGLAKELKIEITEAMDEAGKYTSEIHDMVGIHYLDANKINTDRMKENGTLFKNESITHRIPFCPRSGTPLVQKAQASWFIDIQSQKEKLLKANEQINWFPEHLKFGRFAKGIESAPDWCISRTRYWGAPMPVWMGDDGEKLVVGSREEIYELNKPYGQLEKREVDGKMKYFFTGGEFAGQELNLHKPYIDAVKLQSPKTGNELTRIPEVLDVWMDSGSMPYAQMHYPFENKGEMEASFPADFIAEYVGQVRAWFYVMHVLGVLLNPNNEPTPTPSFTNVITTGVINGNDGRKMSKSFGNYPDPRLTIEKYGADPIRFYMLNSPLLSGGDMDFKEEGIIETIKSVMLPLWNTYSFFTTYANIDGWTPDTTDIYFIRHGATVDNDAGKMSGGGTDSELSDTGREHARERGQFFREHGIGFDVIVTTNLKRTHQTAEIIADEIGFDGEWDTSDALMEQHIGEYEGQGYDDLRQQFIAENGHDKGWGRIYRENSTEHFTDFAQRVKAGYDALREKHKGKRILIIAHGGTGRALGHTELGYDYENTMVNFPPIRNCEVIHMPGSSITNPLDRWILSKLQVLIGKVHDAMDAYDVSRATRSIVEYMDELTNWYVRLSRRRFWGSEMTADKASAYETLYTVLVEVSKLLAPYMPFLAENIFQGLTKKESVHLEYITLPSRHLIDHDLNRDMELAEHIVSLGLALRSRQNIRVRQPLASVTITSRLDEYYQSIIRDELNVKEVKIENPEKLAKKICKPDARKIGPKYGKDVQKVIVEAKNGNFVEKENGIIDVSGYQLKPGEYTMEYLPLEGAGDVEGGYGIVVAMDTALTEDLKLEGYARDIIRQIQDMRKEASYQVTDRISLHIAGHASDEQGTAHDLVTNILNTFGKMITDETLSTLSPLMSNPDLEKELDLDDGVKVTIQIEK